MTHERHFPETFPLSNVFLLRFNGLMMSSSLIHSAIFMWKCNVASRDTLIWLPIWLQLHPITKIGCWPYPSLHVVLGWTMRQCELQLGSDLVSISVNITLVDVVHWSTLDDFIFLCACLPRIELPDTKTLNGMIYILFCWHSSHEGTSWLYSPWRKRPDNLTL